MKALQKKIYEMYRDFGDPDYWLDKIIVWNAKEDENYREDYPDIMEINY